MLHGDVLGERARLTPDKLALVDVASGARLTYAELDARAAACARLLRGAGLGLRKGDRYGLLAGNRVEYLECVFAAAKAGLILVPLSTRATAHELKHVVEHSGLRVLFHDAAHAATADALRDLLRRDPSDSGGAASGDGVKLPSTPEPVYISLDSPTRDGDLAYAAARPPLADAPEPREVCDPEDVLFLLYTSGTTGKPKGVCIPHRMVAWNGYNTVACWGLRDDDVSPIFTPLYHAGALGAFLVPIFVVGGTIVLHAGFDPAEIWATIGRERCTVVLGVPTIWKLLAEAPEFASVDLSSVRALMSGGAPLPSFLIETFQRRGVVFKQGYGLTEVGVNCFSMTVAESLRKKGSIGKPLLFTEAKLVDPDDGHEIVASRRPGDGGLGAEEAGVVQRGPEGGSRRESIPALGPLGSVASLLRPGDGFTPAPEPVGELCLRGPHVCQGYWNDAAATAAAMDHEGFFHTGDLARRDAEGFYTIAGRRKDMFISGGVNVYPAEIEGLLLLHPEVADAAVIGVPHETWGEVGCAYVVRRPGAAVESEALDAHLEGRLARYKVPKHWRFVAALPRTPYGKVVKPDLIALWSREQA